MSRKDLFVRHFLKPKKLIRKFIPVIGQIEAFLGIISVVIGKDIDVFESFYASIPVVGAILADGVDGEGGGSGSSGSGGMVQEINAYIPSSGPVDARSIKLKFDHASDTWSTNAGIDLANNTIRIVENETDRNVAFRFERTPSGIVDQGYAEEYLREQDILQPGAGTRAKQGLIGGLLHLPSKAVNAITPSSLLDADAGGIGHAVGVLITVALIGGVVIVGAMALFSGSSLQQYTNYFGGQAADRAAGVGATSQAEQTVGAYQQAKARVFCLLKGPSCLRQWRLNNTQRPGSNEVGQSYGLSIDRFQVGQSEQLDVAYKKDDYAIPISFTISNTRHGLKGIDALNVSYRLRVIDSERGISRPYCDSGWIPVNGFDVRENAKDPWKGNDIYPGTSASTAFLTLDKAELNGVDVKDKFTLRGCEMLQPALGEFRKVRLDIKYDYFSQATLYFEAMSLQNLQSSPDIQKEFKDSVTADTPVKAAISVNEPVLYDQEKLNTGEDAAQPFGARATLGTDEFDVSYKVKGLEVQKSSEVEVAEDQSQDCQFGLTDDGTKPVGGKDGNAVIDSSRWFDKDKKPPIFGCVMELSNPGTISSTGETLTMGVEANYSVAKNENIDSFKIVNTRCTEFDCPLIVPQKEKGDDDYNWKTTCTGVDAGNGCTIVSRAGLTEDSLSKQDVLNKGLDDEIERGEIAVSTDSVDLNADYSAETDGSETAERAFGIKEDRADGIWRGSYYAIVQYTDFNGNKDVEYVELKKDAPSCFKEWKSNNGGKYDDLAVVSYNPQGGAKCGGSGDSGGN